MVILVIIFLILVGILLWGIELFLLTGGLVSGIGGFVCFIAAICVAFSYFGATAGLVVLFCSIALFVGFLILAFRSSIWKKVTLSSAIEGSVSNPLNLLVKIGDKGTTNSRLGPIGIASFEGKHYEVQSAKGIIQAGVEVIVIETLKDKIIVKPLN
jgi:membrane-bound ClpP family serine protease